MDELDFKLRGLVGDTLVSAGAVAYLGAFTSKYRHDLIASWEANCKKNNIPISQVYELVKSMASPNQVNYLWYNTIACFIVIFDWIVSRVSVCYRYGLVCFNQLLIGCISRC